MAPQIVGSTIKRLSTLSGLGFIVVALALSITVPASADSFKDKPPQTKARKGPRPSKNLKKLMDRKQPKLAGSGQVAVKNAIAFLSWASASGHDKDEDIREAVKNARNNKDVMDAFCKEAFDKQGSDHSRALIALSLVGESRSRYGEECLIRFVKQPLPEKGTIVEGEILERTALATLQAKAIDGLAYLKKQSTDRFVIEAAGTHPARIVRAEAIAAYLWNHQYSAEARKKLLANIHESERIFLDRIVRVKGEKGESFNRKLAEYLKKHPEVIPPAPNQEKEKPDLELRRPPIF